MKDDSHHNLNQLEVPAVEMLKQEWKTGKSQTSPKDMECQAGGGSNEAAAASEAED